MVQHLCRPVAGQRSRSVRNCSALAGRASSIARLASDCAIVTLREKVLRPLLSASGRPCPNRPPRYHKTVDACHKAIHYEMGRLFAVLHLAA